MISILPRNSTNNRFPYSFCEVYMKQNKVTFFFLGFGLLLVVGSLYLLTATPAKAQCGSSASSCKNCHEVQGVMPVNADGTAWHQSHAFGDFCYLCHAGNNQATDKVEAHTGMEAPLANIDASCKSCHPDDTAVRAQVYATILGQEVGLVSVTPSGQTTNVASSGTVTSPDTTPADTCASASTELDLNDPNLVNYVQHYNEVVLGIHPTNWGNVIVIGMIVLFVLVGGFIVMKREGLVNISFEETIKSGSKKKLPPDVLEMVPMLAKLSATARRDLRQVLSKPATTKELLAAIARLIK
jgi:hypothetical protein